MIAGAGSSGDVAATVDRMRQWVAAHRGVPWMETATAEAVGSWAAATGPALPATDDRCPAAVSDPLVAVSPSVVSSMAFLQLALGPLLHYHFLLKPGRPFTSAEHAKALAGGTRDGGRWSLIGSPPPKPYALEERPASRSLMPSEHAPSLVKLVMPGQQS